MRKILNLIFKKRDNTNFVLALEKLNDIKAKLELQNVKTIKYKEYYITEIHF